MMKYPQSLDIIFNKLYEYNIKPIIVGGYIRDTLLGTPSNDIDIELYRIDSLQKVEKILQKFGKLNSVGKSFGVCKLLYKNLDLDFSLPRKDNKIASGHQGFQITIDTHLDFKTAASRRDFTINAIGYDVKNRKILDPYHGREDLEKKILKAVDNKKFQEDPLRVLRAIIFATRFAMRLEDSLLFTCKEMIRKKFLEELPKERIFQELKKLLIKSTNPSKGFYLLKELGGFSFFQEFNNLNDNEYRDILHGLERVKKLDIKNEKEFIILAFAVITSKFSKRETESFLHRISNEKKLLEKVLQLHEISFYLENFNESDIYRLAKKIDIEFYSHYLYGTSKKKEKIDYLLTKAKELQVLHHPLPALIQGKDLIRLGLKPSKKFTIILEQTYEAQIKNRFQNKTVAIEWLKKNLLS